MFAHELRRAGFELAVHHASSEAAYLAELELPLDLILADNALPAFGAMRALQILRASKRDIPLIVVTESAGEAVAIECVSLGAADFLFKDRPARLGTAVIRAMDQRELRTHARAAADALRDSEERFRSAYDYAAIGIALIGLDGRWLQANRALCNFIGYTEQELLATTFQAITHPDDLAIDLGNVRSLLAGEIVSYQMEKRYFNKHGATIWALLSVSLVRDAQHEPGYFVSQIQDITERKRSDEALHQKTAFVHLLQEVAVAANLATSLEQALQTAVDAICTHIGWPVGHVYLPDPETPGALISTAIWHLEDAHRFGTFRKSTEVVRLAPGIGLPGQVLKSRKPAWIADIILNANTPRTRIIQKSGIRAGFALPVLLGDDVAAVLEFFATAAIEPDAALLDVLHHVGTQLGRVIERVRGEAALQVSEERFRVLFEHSPDAILLIDPDASDVSWPIVECNDVAGRMNGYTRGEMIGQSIDLLNVVAGTPRERADYIEQLRRDGTIQLTAVHRRKDGSLFPVEVVSSLISVAGRELVLGIDRDISERKRAEAALRESEERFRALFAHSPDAIILIDPHASDVLWPIVECNDIACQMNGYTRAELIGQPINILNISAEDTKEDRAAALDRLRHTGMSHYEVMHRRKDGTYFPVEVRTSVIYVAGRELVLGIDRDISERARAEVALRAAETKYRTLVEQLPAIIYTAAIDEHGTTQYVSPQIEAMLGFSPEEWLANPNLWLEQAHPDDRARMLETIVRVQASDEATSTEYRSYTRDGRLVWLRDMERVVRDQAGRPLFLQGITLDITDRKLAEAALSEREAYFRALIEHSADAIALFAIDGTILYGSPAMPRILGYPELQLLGRNVLDLIHPDDRAQFAAQLDEITRSPEATVSIQARVQHADGTWRDLEGQFTNLLNNPAVGAIVTNYRDITDRKRADIALRESERLYHTLASNFPNGAVVLFDHDLRFTIADGSGLADIGLSPERLEGYTLWEIYPPEALQVNEPIFRAALAGTPSIREVTTGDLTLVIYTLPVRDEHGAIIAGMLMSQNITERKRIEEALRLSVARFRAVWDGAHDAMVLSDPDGMVLEANPAYVQLYGYTSDQIIGQPYSIIFPAAQRAAALEAYSAFFRDPPSVMHVESLIQRADGSARWVETSASFLVQDQHRTALLSLIRDITERKRMEAELIDERALLARRIAERTADLSAANAELARTARLKDEFLASMSHELRTPLNAVLGLSEALQEEVYGPLNDRQRQNLHHIEESGRHLLALINDILDLAKIGAGKLELVLEQTSVAAVCQASLRMVKQAAHTQRITVESSFDPAVTSVWADARRLKQILVNLLSNAVKFTPAGGTIGLAVSGDAASQRISFTIWDTGIGIAPEHLDQLFLPFVQLDSRLARQYEGTGLGLALVARMVELHSGSIAVSSTLGVGSRFTVALPWQPVEEPALARAPLAPERVAAPRDGMQQALIIEDSPTTADQLRRYLAESGILAETLAAGHNAVAHATTLQPALILLDIMLPDISGWEVLATLKATPRTRDIPVVIVSVMDERIGGQQRGAAGFLVKPCTRSDLRLLLAQLGIIGAADRLIQAARRMIEAPTILLADDNEVTITMIVDYLVAHGYQVVVARDGAEAIVRAHERRPALILMDIQMPGIDGLEVTRRIRADAVLGAIPIIALTALAMPGDRELCLEAGANDYLSKPLSLAELAATIALYLQPIIPTDRSHP